MDRGEQTLQLFLAPQFFPLFEKVLTSNPYDQLLEVSSDEEDEVDGDDKGVDLRVCEDLICSVCEGGKNEVNEAGPMGEMLICDHCNDGYHQLCLQPAQASQSRSPI